MLRALAQGKAARAYCLGDMPLDCSKVVDRVFCVVGSDMGRANGLHLMTIRAMTRKLQYLGGRDVMDPEVA